MPSVSTDAIVLHVFDYLETSRIIRLVTREVGVVSVLARGARRSSGRFGSALDLFAGGTAQLEMRPNRELQTLSGFDVLRAREPLAASMSRFTAASAFSEAVQRLVTEEHASAAFEITRDALDAMVVASEDEVVGQTLAALWRLVAELGVTPELSTCVSCGRGFAADDVVPFSHSAGGVLCSACARGAAGARRLPRAAREAIEQWLGGSAGPALSETEGKAHQRLLREFLGHHLLDARTLRAWTVWEESRW